MFDHMNRAPLKRVQRNSARAGWATMLVGAIISASAGILVATLIRFAIQS